MASNDTVTVALKVTIPRAELLARYGDLETFTKMLTDALPDLDVEIVSSTPVHAAVPDRWGPSTSF